MIKTKKRRILWILLGVISSVLLIGFMRFVVYEYFERGISNYKNAKLVLSGMEASEIIRIMGKPDTIIESKQLESIPEKTNIYYYENKPVTSAMIRIYVDSTERVAKVLIHE